MKTSRFRATVPRYVIHMSGPPGEEVSAGETYDVRSPKGFARFNGSKYEILGLVEGFDFQIRPKDFGTLHRGRYTRAERHGASTRHPYFDVRGRGRGCEKTYATFTIHSLSFFHHGYGSLRHLNLSFVQHCERPKAPPLRGTIRYDGSPSLPGIRR